MGYPNSIIPGWFLTLLHTFSSCLSFFQADLNSSTETSWAHSLRDPSELSREQWHSNIWNKSELVPSMLEELLSIILALSDPDPGDSGDLFSDVR